jgi:hypothetical protein
VTQATNWVMMAMVEISLQEQMNVAFRKKKQEKMHVHSDGQLLRSANLPRCCGTMMKSSGWSFGCHSFPRFFYRNHCYKSLKVFIAKNLHKLTLTFFIFRYDFELRNMVLYVVNSKMRMP